MKNKTFVLDTNVLIHDPQAMTKFNGCHVVLPLTVIEELDRLKKDSAEVGKNAREAIRLLDTMVREKNGNLHEGIPLENDSKVRVEVLKTFDSDLVADRLNPDNWIIMTCLRLKGSTQVVFVSRDLAARVKALSFGLEAEDYENYKVKFETIYTGYNDLQVPKELLDLLRKDGVLAFEKIAAEFLPKSWGDRKAPVANEYFRLRDQASGEIFVRYEAKRGVLRDLPALPKSIWGLKPRNPQQRCALDMLLDDKIKLVSLLGMAGTGKTLLALAGALRKVFDDSTYARILVSRPIIPLGKDIGYLPGSKEEKLFHWMQPIYDNLEFLCQSEDPSDIGDGGDVHKWVLESKKIELEAITYIRGRSLPKVYFIIDEAQNLTPHEVKTIVSRAGEGTKVILTGDPTQIDSPYLDRDYNALTYTIGRFQNYDLFGHIQLEKTERSELAALAAQIL